jgi:hypothetical protein
MLGISAAIPHGIAAIRLTEPRVKAFVKIWPRLGEKNDLTLINLINLTGGVRNRCRRCDDPWRPRYTPFLDDLVAQKRRETAKGMEKRCFK